MAENLRMQIEPHIKRMACQIYTQLPEDKREALLVLQYVRQIIFCLGEDWDAVLKTAAILPFQSQEMKGPAAKLRAVEVGLSDRPDKSNQE
jgi:hypothetical protein